jgi:hypothetical protein
VVKPILAFLPFCFRSLLVVFASRGAPFGTHRRRKQTLPKSRRGNKQKGMQKGGLKSALIPYLDNIEITSIEIFDKTPEKSAKTPLFMYNRFLSVYNSTLLFGRIWSYVFLGGKNSRERGSLLREISKTHTKVFYD